MSAGSNAGALAARLMLDTNGFQAAMSQAGQVSDRELKRIQRQVKFVSDYVQEMAKSQRAANNATDMSRATAQMVDFGKSVELSQKQITRANQILPAQITDIVTSLASGQKPWLVAIQQGGQIKDMYGGIGNALKAVSALITPASLAFSVLGGAVIAAGTAMYQGAMAAIKFRDDTILSGNAAGMTASRFDAVAERITRASAQTVGASKDILSELISSGKTSAAVIEGQALAIARIADLSGKDAAKIADTFTDQLKEPAKFAAKLNETYNFLDVATFKRIQLLEQQKRFEDAVVLTNKTLTERLADQRNELGNIETALETTKKKWSEWWQAAMNWGKPDSVAQQLADVRKMISNITEGGTREPARGTASESVLANLRFKAAALAERYKQEQAAAEAQSKAAETNRRGIAGELKKDGNDSSADDYARLMENLRRYKTESLQMQDAARKWGDAEHYRAERMAEVEKLVGKRTAQEIALARAEIDAAYNERKRGEVAQELLKDQQKRAEFTEELVRKERDAFIRDQEARAEFTEEMVRKERNLERQRNAPFSEAAGSAITKYMEDIGNRTKLAEQIVNGAFKRMEDAIIDFAKTGQLSFSSLWTFMAEEYLRQVIRMGAKSLLMDSGNFIGLSGLFSKGSSFFGGLFGNAPQLASGLEYVPYDGYPAILHKGERVQDAVSAASDRNGGRGMVVDASVSMGQVGSNVSRAEVMSYVQKALGVQKQQIMRTLRQQGGTA